MISAIKARLGSVSASKMSQFPQSVQKILQEDMPKLISALESLRDHKIHFASTTGGGCVICEALNGSDDRDHDE